MLVLSRKELESIVIGSDIKVTVQSIRGGRVRLAIEAPRQVRVVRLELKGSELDDSNSTKID